VRSLIKLNATVISRLPAGAAVSWFYCFCGTILDPYRENLVALGGESCSSSRETGSDSCVQLYQWTHCTIIYFAFEGTVLCCMWPIRGKVNSLDKLSVDRHPPPPPGTPLIPNLVWIWSVVQRGNIRIDRQTDAIRPLRFHFMHSVLRTHKGWNKMCRCKSNVPY
jgi:hypothetical protein